MTLDPRLAVIAQNIRRMTDASPLTVTEIAAEIGVKKSAVSKWRTGKRTPTMANLYALADVLECDVGEFWRGAQALPATPEQRLMVEYMARMSKEQQQSFLALARATSNPKT